eukprot:scaffold108720_cov40-Attheya_sp.AAC.2
MKSPVYRPSMAVDYSASRGNGQKELIVRYKELQQQIRLFKDQVEYYEGQREQREERDEEDKKMAALPPAKEKKQHIQGRVLPSAVAGKTKYVQGRHTITNNTFKESLASSIDEAVNLHS